MDLSTKIVAVSARGLSLKSLAQKLRAADDLNDAMQTYQALLREPALEVHTVELDLFDAFLNAEHGYRSEDVFEIALREAFDPDPVAVRSIFFDKRHFRDLEYKGHGRRSTLLRSKKQGAGKRGR